MNRKIWFYVIICSGLLMLFSGCEKDERIKIPDDNFLNALIESGVDTDADGKISKDEAEAIDSLDVDGSDISDLTGIEAFVNLIDLLCGRNQLTNLDVSNNTALKHLFCFINNLTTLDVSKNTALESLDFSLNGLTTLDVSNNTALEWLFCDYNNLTSLDISNNTSIHSLGIRNMPSLYKVCVWEMPITTPLDVFADDSPNFYFTTDCTK